MIFVMLTDIIEESTILISEGEGADEMIGRAFSAKGKQMVTC